MGDLNINLLKHNSKRTIQNFYDIMCSNYFLPYILQPTRIANNSKTLIDNIFLNTTEYKSYSGNLTSSISDHLIQFVFLTNLKKVFKIQKQENLKRDFSVYNEDEFSKRPTKN